MSMETFPTELLIIVLGLVAKDQSSLASCARVNRRWHLLTRQRLYSSPQLNRHKAVEAFLRSVSGAHMAQYLGLTKETNRERHHALVQRSFSRPSVSQTSTAKQPPSETKLIQPSAPSSSSSSSSSSSARAATFTTAAATTSPAELPSEFLSALMPVGGLVDVFNLTMLPHRWETIYPQHIQGLVPSCPWISELNIRNCTKLRDDEVQMIAENLGPRHLRSLVLSSCILLTDLAVLSICAHTKELENLELSGCVRLTDISILELSTATISVTAPLSPPSPPPPSSSPPITTLSSLSLSLDNDQELTSTGAVIRGTSRTLKSLDVSYCSRITEVGIRALHKGAIKLSSLNMEGCYGVLLNDDEFVANGWEDVDDVDSQDDEIEI